MGARRQRQTAAYKTHLHSTLTFVLMATFHVSQKQPVILSFHPGAEPLRISGMDFLQGRCCSCHQLFVSDWPVFESPCVYRSNDSQITSVLRRRPSSRHCRGACSLPCVASGPFVCSLEASISQSPSYSQQTALCVPTCCTCTHARTQLLFNQLLCLESLQAVLVPEFCTDSLGID